MLVVFDLEEELREIVTSAIDLNRAKCTHDEIVLDIAPNIKRIYQQGEIEGRMKGIDECIMQTVMRERLLSQIAEPSSPRFREIKALVVELKKLKGRQIGMGYRNRDC